MKQDEIIEMAVQAGMAEEIAAFNIPIIEAFAKLIAAKATASEREACAQIADKHTKASFMGAVGAAIRARGKQE
jgi:hypothetical protein